MKIRAKEDTSKGAYQHSQQIEIAISEPRLQSTDSDRRWQRPLPHNHSHTPRSKRQPRSKRNQTPTTHPSRCNCAATWIWLATCLTRPRLTHSPSKRNVLWHPRYTYPRKRHMCIGGQEAEAARKLLSLYQSRTRRRSADS